MGKRNTALDGLRFVAVLLVVSSHCQILKQGGLGNAIFFALSGFLAIRPFAQNSSDDFKGIKRILRYYLSRIIRIVPVFWICIIGVFLLNTLPYFDINDTESFQSLILNMFFIKSQGHLWFLQQEMFFYFVFPFLSLILVAMNTLLDRIIKNRPVSLLIISAFLMICSLLCEQFLTKDVFFLYGNGDKMSFRLGQFMVGISAGYIYCAFKASSLKVNRASKITASMYGLIFLAFCIVSAEPIASGFIPEMKGVFVGWSHPILCSTFSSLFILSVTICDDSFTAKLMGNRLFSYLGSISFIIYLTHWYLLSPFKQDDPVKHFILVFLISASLASALHTLVEKPSIIFSKRYKPDEVLEYYKKL